jgi:hypothetical protein
MSEHKLTEDKLLAMLAQSRRHREVAEPVDLDVCGGLTFERACALSGDPSLMTQEERQLIASSPRAARLIEHFKQARRSLAGNRVEPPGAPDIPTAPTPEELATPAQPTIDAD